MLFVVFCVNFPDEKRYACNVCPARFKDGSSCRRHVREHTAGKMHICTVCSMPFKRAAQLKNHVQQQHGTQDAVGFVLNAAGNIDPVDYTDLPSRNPVNALYCNSGPAAAFDMSQQLQFSDVIASCEMIAEDNNCSTTQCEILPAACHSLETTKATDIDTGSWVAMVSAGSEGCDHSGFSATDKSITVAAQSLDYARNTCPQSVPDLLFSQERADPLTLPLPSLAEDSIPDIIDTSDPASFPVVHDSSLSSFNRPDITDATYLSWHVQFADTMCFATVPLSDDQLCAVTSVWSSLVSDMTTVMTGTSVAHWQQNYPALLDVVHKLGAVVESHLQILQPTVTA